MHAYLFCNNDGLDPMNCVEREVLSTREECPEKSVLHSCRLPLQMDKQVQVDKAQDPIHRVLLYKIMQQHAKN